MDSNTRYETLAALYDKRFGDLAPGKDSPLPRSVSNEENIARWNDWRMSGQALKDALDRIAELEGNSRR